WMLALAAYLDYVRRGGALRYLLVLLCFTLGLMAKPMIVSLPLVLLVLDFWPLNRVSGARCEVSGDGRPVVHLTRRTSYRTLFLEKIPLFALAFAACVVTWLV